MERSLTFRYSSLPDFYLYMVGRSLLMRNILHNDVSNRTPFWYQATKCLYRVSSCKQMLFGNCTLTSVYFIMLCENIYQYSSSHIVCCCSVPLFYRFTSPPISLSLISLIPLRPLQLKTCSHWTTYLQYIFTPWILYKIPNAFLHQHIYIIIKTSLFINSRRVIRCQYTFIWIDIFIIEKILLSCLSTVASMKQAFTYRVLLFRGLHY